LRKIANSQTNRQTKKQRRLHILLGGCNISKQVGLNTVYKSEEWSTTVWSLVNTWAV